MEWILYGMPNAMLDAIPRVYPGVLITADDGFQKGDSIGTIGSQIAATVIADLLLNGMRDERRDRIREQVMAVAKGGERRTDEDIFVSVILIASRNTEAMTAVGKMRPEDDRMFRSEMYGALGGLSYQERSRQRVERYLTDAIGTTQRLS
jgi:hypothetical protein